MRVEKIFVLMALAFLAYPVVALLAHPDWGAVAYGALVPTLHGDSGFLILLVGTLGTTISPYQLLFQQSAIVERGAARQHYGPERADAYVGAFISNVISMFIIIATAATLHAAGKANLQTAADVAQALKPVAGDRSEVVFAIGIIGASLLAAGVLPLATSYAVSEAFGFRKGINLDFRRAPFFQGLVVTFIVIGAVVALIAPLDTVVQWMVYVQVLNGMLTPVILVFLLLLANDRRLVGNLKNSWAPNVVGWGTCALITLAIVVLLGVQFLGALGITLRT
jgi:Mn2+/Fe2+ NRAMP family transporter